MSTNKETTLTVKIEGDNSGIIKSLHEVEKYIDTLLEKFRQLNEFLAETRLCSQLHKGDDEDDQIKEPEYCITPNGPVRCGQNLNRKYAETDEFRCSECGIHLEDWIKCADEENDVWVEYEFNYCPNCGSKMKRDEG